MSFEVKISIRWSDVDANRHLANSAYMNYMSHTRMQFLEKHGFGMSAFHKLQIGPITLKEELIYFKEVLGSGEITVDAQLAGHTEDHRFFRFEHRFYTADGSNFALGKMQGAWLDLRTRKTTPPPSEIVNMLEYLPRTPNFGILKKEDLRDPHAVPVHKS